jgi:pimeloyl-ACP methyl ester carboxylesterase
MAFSQSTQIKLHYIITASAKQTVITHHKFILIHGLFFGNLAGWFPLITQALAEHGDVLCYDLRGHGLSETPPSGYHFSAHLNDLTELITEVGWKTESIYFIGHSFGARLALAMLCERKKQDQVNDRIMLIDPPLLTNNHDDQRLFEELKTIGIDGLSEHIPSSLMLMFTKEGRRLKKMFKRWRRLIEETTFLDEIDGLGDVSNDELSSIQSHGSVLFGSESGCIRAHPLLEPLLPTSRLHIISEGGHFLLNQCPETVLIFIEKQLLGDHL